jgi:hypothetical protein
MKRSHRSAVGALVMMLFAATCTESTDKGPSTERTGGTGGSRPAGSGGSTAGRGGSGGTGGTGGSTGGSSPGGGMTDGGKLSDGGKMSDGGGMDAAAGTGGSGGTGGMTDGGKADGGKADGGKADGAGGVDGSGKDAAGGADGMGIKDAAGPPDKPADAKVMQDAAGPTPMRDAAPYRDAAGPGTNPPPGGADYCPTAIRHTREHPPGGVGVGQGVECDNVNVNRVACDQAGQQRYECAYNATPQNPANFGKHWEACNRGGRRCQTCRLTVVVERPPPYFNPFSVGQCN